MVMATESPDTHADALVRPVWLRLRFWLAVAALLVAGGVIALAIPRGNTRALDPSSAARAGSKALAEVLRGYGIPVERTTSLATAAATPAGSTVVVPAPFAYSTAQLAELAASAARLVIARPTTAELDALGLPVSAAGSVPGGATSPGCSAPGAVAAGDVELPLDTSRFDAPTGSGLTACYDDTVLLGEHVSVLGAAALLRNDTLADTGVAALDVNVISDNRSTHRVVWLVPGTEATATAARDYWQLFPDGARRAFLWLLPLGLLLVLWRGRRFGPVVTEPLPVVVRSAEVVEGHGRLYRRAGARDRAAAALRAATVQRLTVHAGLQRGAGVPELVSAVAVLTGRDVNQIADLLAGPAPVDDHALVALAARLDALETAAGVPPRPKDNRP